MRKSGVNFQKVRSGLVFLQYSMSLQVPSTLSVCFLNFLTFCPTKGAPALGSVTVFSKFQYIFWYTLGMSFGEVIPDQCIDAFSVHSLVHGPHQHLFIGIYR